MIKTYRNVASKYVIRVEYKPLMYVLGGMLFFYLALDLLAYKYGHVPDEEFQRNIFLILLLAVVFILIVWYTASRKIILEDEYLTYQSGFIREKIRYVDIISSDIDVRFNKMTQTYWNVITKGNHEYTFWLTHYTKSDLQKLAQILLAKSSMALHSALVHDAANGIFDWSRKDEKEYRLEE